MRIIQYIDMYVFPEIIYNIYTCMRVCMCTNIYIYIYIYTYIHI